MPDLKKFLRFEISGYVALLYAGLFCLAFSDLKKLGSLFVPGNRQIIDYSVTGFILAGPIGFIMHQIDITFFSPFRKKRPFNCFRKFVTRGKDSFRKVIPLLGSRLSSSRIKNFDDEKFQAMLELALSKDVNKHLEDEISNRYSYYYARMEAGLFSPLFGLLIYFIAYLCFQSMTQETLFNASWITAGIFIGVAIISWAILAYCPTLFRELNDLESSAVEKGLKAEDFQ